MQSVESRGVEKSLWRSINKVHSIVCVYFCVCESEYSRHAAAVRRNSKILYLADHFSWRSCETVNKDFGIKSLVVQSE